METAERRVMVMARGAVGMGVMVGRMAMVVKVGEVGKTEVAEVRGAMVATMVEMVGVGALVATTAGSVEMVVKAMALLTREGQGAPVVPMCHSRGLLMAVRVESAAMV